MIYRSIMRTLMALIVMFPTVFNKCKSATDILAHKNFPEDNFSSKICYRYDNKTRNFKSALRFALV